MNREPDVNYFKVSLGDGLKSTLRLMKELEIKALNEKMFVNWIHQNFRVSTCPVCSLKKVWQYVHNNFEYREDEYDEVLISPAIIISKRFGDCDDFSLFIHTVLTALGIESKYILLGAEKNQPTHIAVYSLKKVIDGTNQTWNVIPDKYKYFSLV